MSYRHTQNSFQFGEINPKSAGYVGTDYMASSLRECKGFMPFPSGGIMRTPGTFFSHSDFETDKTYCRQEILKVEGQSETVIDGIKTFGNDTYLICIYAGKTYAFIYTKDETSGQIIAKTKDGEVMYAVVDNTYELIELPELSITTNKGKMYIAHVNHDVMIYDLFNSTKDLISLQNSVLDFDGVTFDGDGNHPSNIAFKSGRMMLAGTANKPSTVWLSRTPTVMDTDSINVEFVDRYTDFTLFDTTTTKINTITGGELVNGTVGTVSITKTLITYSTGANPDYTVTEIYKDKKITYVDTVKHTTKTTITIEKSAASSSDDDLTITIIRKEIETERIEDGVTVIDYTYQVLEEYTPLDLNSYGTLKYTEDIDIKKILDSSHAIEVEESDLAGSRIKWISPMGKMAIATSNVIFISDGNIPTPSTFDLSISTYQPTGSSNIKTIRNYILFTGRGNTSLNLAYYDYTSESLAVQDISQTAKHLFNSEIVDFTIMFDPFPIIWVITKNGDLISGVISMGTSISVGWSVQKPQHNRKYISLEIAGDNSNTISLYVQTTNDDETTYSFETLTINEENEVSNFIFTDNSTIVIPNITKQLIVNNYLTGDKLQVIVDNDEHEYLGEYIVSGNELVLTDYDIQDGDTFRVGLKKDAYISFYPPVLSSNGLYMITKHSIVKILLRMYESGIGYIKSDENSTVNIPIIYKTFGHSNYGEKIELITKDVEIGSPLTVSNDRYLKIYVDDPFPFNLLAISYKYNVTED